MPAPLPIQPPRLLRGGLASVAVDVPLPVEEWRTGVIWTTQCEVDSFVWGCDSAERGGGGQVKPAAALGADEPEFYPGVIGARTTCDIAGSRTIIGDRVRTIAEQMLDRTRYGQLAQILADGDVGRDAAGVPDRNPSVVYDGQVPANFNNNSPSTLRGTMQGLMDAACTCWDQQLVFHVPRPYLAQFLHERLVVWDEADGVYRMGDHLVSFDCYPNIGPDQDFAGNAQPDQNVPAADGSEVWIWATSRPMIGLDEVMDDYSHRDVRQNSYDVVAEQGAIVMVDPCCIYAAKAVVSG